MPQMAAFVYEFYIQKVQAMKSAFYGAQKVWQRPGTYKAVIPEHLFHIILEQMMIQTVQKNRKELRVT